MSQKDERARIVGLPGTPEPPRAAEAGPRPPVGDRLDHGEPSLADYVWTIVEHRALVAVVTLSAVLLAGTYLFLVAPTYRSDVLVQVEDKTKGIAGIDDLTSALSDKTPADTEMEIIRSRSLLGNVVDQLNLTIEGRPRTFPVVGGALYRKYRQGGVAPPVLGLARFAWGGERIAVARLETPDELVGLPLELVAGGDRRFQLFGPKDQPLLAGEVGKVASAGEGEARLEVFVSQLVARPGTRFALMRRYRDDVIDDLQRDLRIAEKGKKTGIISISVEGRDPRRIAAILDAIAQTYQRQNVERKSAEAAKTLEFLEEQLPLLKRNLDAAEGSLNGYQLKKGSVDLSIETQALLDRSVEIEKALTELDLQRSDLSRRFTESHPALAALKEKGDKLRAERAAMNAKMKGVPEQELESARLTRDVKVSAELYFLLLNKSQELKVVKSGTIGNVRILDTALRPHRPVSPNAVPVLALALLLGLAGGVVLAFVKQAFDRGVDDPDEIEQGTGLAIYASVPHSDRQTELNRRRRSSDALGVLAVADPADLAVESLRSLRTGLQFALVEATNNVVTIGGPSPGIGKSFLCANLAHVLASTGKRVLLVDADLRRGRLHRYFGGERAPGVSEAVSAQAALADVLRKTSHENLDFVATGAIPPNPSEVVGSQRFQAFLAEVSARYDLVLVDTPPILAVTDAALIARHAGVNLLVLRAGQHPMREIALALKRLAYAGVRVHGAVLNDVQAAHGKYAYQYNYNYEYRPSSDERS